MCKFCDNEPRIGPDLIHCQKLQEVNHEVSFRCVTFVSCSQLRSIKTRFKGIIIKNCEKMEVIDAEVEYLELDRSVKLTALTLSRVRNLIFKTQKIDIDKLPFNHGNVYGEVRFENCIIQNADKLTEFKIGCLKIDSCEFDPFVTTGVNVVFRNLETPIDVTGSEFESLTIDCTNVTDDIVTGDIKTEELILVRYEPDLIPNLLKRSEFKKLTFKDCNCFTLDLEDKHLEQLSFIHCYNDVMLVFADVIVDTLRNIDSSVSCQFERVTIGKFESLT